MEEHLLIKHLLGETDDRESERVAKWLAEDAGHQKRYAQMKWLWEKAAISAASSEVNVDHAWERFRTLRDEKNGASTAGNQRQLWTGWRKMAAAGVLLVLVVGAVAIYLPHSGRALFSTVVLVSDKTPRNEVLLDGSVITMNKHARLTYAQNWNKRDRMVYLAEGEVYFDVVKNPAKPFVVRAGEMTLTVLGTSFHVNQSTETIEVIVDAGEVRVAYQESIVFLRKNEKVIIDTVSGDMEKGAHSDQLFRYYVDGKFVAKSTALPELVNVLNEAYGSNIEIASKKAQNMSITTTLEYGSLEDNLAVIRETLGLRITREGMDIVVE